MNFKTSLPYREPDGEFYAHLKHLTVMDHQPGESLHGVLSGDSFRSICEYVGEEAYEFFYGCRLKAALCAQTGHDHLARFPGTHVPSIGNNGRVYSLGSLAWDRFVRACAWEGGALDSIDQLPFTLEPVSHCQWWPWSVPEPGLTAIIPSSKRPIVCENQLLQMKHSVLFGEDPMRIIEQSWSPRTRSFHKENASEIARAVLSDLKVSPASIPFLFELEDVLGYGQWTHARTCVGRGVYRGCWLEVYLLPLSEIRNTEIAQTPRVLQELLSLIERGFAPLVVNEYGANVDGTHRQTASWLWNLLSGLDPGDLRLNSSDLQTHVRSFVDKNTESMGPVTIREVLRILAEFILDETSLCVLKNRVLPHMKDNGQITHLPVMFLRETTWPTVRYREYLGGEKAVRVDPLVYERMSQDPSLVLPAHGQGPYHLTDRELVYWFDVLAINRL